MLTCALFDILSDGGKIFFCFIKYRMIKLFRIREAQLHTLLISVPEGGEWDVHAPGSGKTIGT